MQNAASSKGPVWVGTREEMMWAADCPPVIRHSEWQPRYLSAPRLEQKSGSHWLPISASLCPLTAVVSLCSRKEHLWDDRPPFSREDGVDHPSDCGISLDLRVPHPSHCCASLLEVSKPGSTCKVGGVGGICWKHAALGGCSGEQKPVSPLF